MKAILSSKEVLVNAPAAVGGDRSALPWLELIREAVEGVDYGAIQIKIHGGAVVQIEATRKIRVPSAASSEPSNPSRPTALTEVTQTKR